MIALRGLEKAYQQGRTRTFVLRQIDLDIAEGDFVTIMGPSGAGKTTLLSILGMLDGDWSGEFSFYDHPVHKLKNQERLALGKKYIGFVFQQYHLLDDLTVAENIDLPLSYRDESLPRRTCIPHSCLADSSSWWRWHVRLPALPR
ncbi:MAG: ATP-binding cassette domain-containing protein [Gemmatimonadales bacterium]|jgi:ABC-type lipoprotein export system ATPase subunit